MSRAVLEAWRWRQSCGGAWSFTPTKARPARAQRWGFTACKEGGGAGGGAGRHLALETLVSAPSGYLYEEITSPFLGFCFDSGHASAFTPGSDPLALFGHRLVTTHLSDNLSPEAGDLHLRPGLGTVDFSSLIPRILALKPGISLNLESVRSQQDAQARLDLTAYLKASYAGIARHIDGPASGRRDVFI